MYILGKPRQVVLSQWVGLVAVIAIGIILIPPFGPAGALIADGMAQLITGGLMLAFLWKDLPRKYPLSFSMRLLLAVTLAALPSIVWHPTDRLLLGVSGTLFLLLCIGLLLWIKPLNDEDLEMVSGLNARLGGYLHWFARK